MKGHYIHRHGKMEGEVIWLEEFSSYSEAKETISQWIERDYNRLYPHSALGYRSPVEFEAMVACQAKAA